MAFWSMPGRQIGQMVPGTSHMLGLRDVEDERADAVAPESCIGRRERQRHAFVLEAFSVLAHDVAPGSALTSSSSSCLLRVGQKGGGLQVAGPPCHASLPVQGHLDARHGACSWTQARSLHADVPPGVRAPSPPRGHDEALDCISLHRRRGGAVAEF